MTYELPWFTIILTLWYQINNFNTEYPQNGVDKLGLNRIVILKFFVKTFTQQENYTFHPKIPVIWLFKSVGTPYSFQ